MKRPIYLDYAAATPLDPAAERAMRPYQADVFGNPGALHRAGQAASAAVFRARRAIAGALGADYREIFFTGSATEANNMALRGVAHAALRDGHVKRPKILISAIEHESVRETAHELERECGVEVVEIPVDTMGKINIDRLQKALDERVILVSVQFVNSELGIIQPIKEIGEIIRSYKLKASSSSYPLFHTDAAQAFNYLKCDMKALGADMLTLSAHKIYGPKGIGVLHARCADLLSPVIVGGGQESGLRSGTENVPAIVGFAAAVAVAEKTRAKESKRVGKLRDALWKEMLKIVPDAELNGSATERVPNSLNVYFPGRSAQDLVIELDISGVMASPGTACSSRTAQPSYVIAALGHSGDRPSASVRFSLGRQTTAAEISQVARIFKKRFAA